MWQSCDWKRCYVTSGDWKWPGSYLTGSHLEVAVGGQKLAFVRVYALQGFRSQDEAVRWQEMTSHDLTWPEVTRKWRHLSESPKSGCKKPKTRVLRAALMLCWAVTRRNVAVTWQEMTSSYLRCLQVTRKWRHFNVSYQEVGVGGQTLCYVRVYAPTGL